MEAFLRQLIPRHLMPSLFRGKRSLSTRVRDLPNPKPSSRHVPTALSGRCGLQPEQQRRDKFGHGRMDRHGPTELIVGRLRIDGIEDAVDSLVAACTEN